ncbi:MAG: COX15/CtaA family protein [Sinobacteraceae bacterium]|nr:COX15/CtaA family protein [Nevskiaceae bacterium]
MRRLALAGLLLCFVVVVLGAYVRLTAAGLGCPDWPGCYGHLSPVGAQESSTAQAAFPSRPLDVGKAWREMIHRYAASTLGLIIVALAVLAAATRRLTRIGLPLALALLATVLVQGMLGMLTVTWQLKPLIVTAHLLFGLTTLSLLWWCWLSLADQPLAATDATTPSAGKLPGSRDAPLRALVVAALVALGVQIALGGWTSSNYAAISCPDFPTCQGRWWPASDYHSAFVLWRGLDINYEGGILAGPARVAIHLTHRLGALAVTVLLLTAALTILARRPRPAARAAAIAVLLALGLQLTIGISMVVRGFPLWLATAHTGGAALLLLSVIALLRVVSGPTRA